MDPHPGNWYQGYFKVGGIFIFKNAKRFFAGAGDGGGWWHFLLSWQGVRWGLGMWGDGEVGRWRSGEVEMWGGRDVGKWGGGKMRRWGDGEVGRWRCEEVVRWAGGEVGR